TLDDPARGWFDWPSNGCIDNWADLWEKFTERTVTEMMKRVDNFIKSKEVYKSTELPRGEFPEKGQGAPSRENKPPRVENNHLNLESLTKRSKEILATELQLQLPPCPPMLEIILESGKLSHIVKDVKQRVSAKGRHHGNNNGKGRTGIQDLQVVSSTIYAMMKFPTPRGIATLVSRAVAIFEC
ncbi:hypothetical protein Tco_1463563, partial [Tanacetum coccineum]